MNEADRLQCKQATSCIPSEIQNDLKPLELNTSYDGILPLYKSCISASKHPVGSILDLTNFAAPITEVTSDLNVFPV